MRGGNVLPKIIRGEMQSKKNLLEQISDEGEIRRMSTKNVTAYVSQTRRFVRPSGMRHPLEGWWGGSP
jgi:hypothetical protein